MADDSSSTLRSCKHCKTEKPLDAFVGWKGTKLHKCKDCRSAERRAQYAARSGEYAKRDTEEERRKRRQAARASRGRYIWQAEWLNQRPTKICAQCQIDLPANPAWFRLETRNTTGLNSWCRACEARDYDANKAKRLAGQREYWRKRMDSDPDALRRNRRDWQDRNREKYRAQCRRWREQNLEKAREYGVASEAKRRARKVKAGGHFSAIEIARLLDSQKHKCWYCSVKLKKYHVDHRIPLARGGTNDLSNLVIACPTCNLSKGAKMPWELKNPRLL